MRRSPRIVGSTLALVALAAVMLGRPAPTSARPSEDDESTTGGVSVAVFVMPEGKVSRGELSLLARSIEQALKQNERLSVKDHDLLLAEFAGEVPADVVAKARDLLAAGKELLARGRAKEAGARLRAAETAFESVLAYVKKQELAEAQFLLGVAEARLGDRKGALATFERLYSWRPTYPVDPTAHAELVPMWEQAAGNVEGRPRGSLEVLTEPDGALAFVDGKFLGVTPVTAEGLVVGPHYITLTLEGYQRRVVKARVDAQYQELVTESLPRSEKVLLLEQSLDRARPALGKAAADPAMMDLRSFLFIDQAVFVRVTPRGNGLWTEAYVYDLRSKQRLSRVSSTVPRARKASAEACQRLATSLYSGVRYDGRTADDDQLAREAGRPRRDHAPRPIYRKWWFWTAAVAAAAAVAVPIVVVGSGDDGPACPGGYACGQVFLDY